MPYVGVGIKNDKYRLSIKVHGPLDYIDLNTVELRNFVQDQLLYYATNNMPAICHKLSYDICDKFCNGVETVWAQVEMVTNNEVLYGSSAERILPREESGGVVQGHI